MREVEVFLVVDEAGRGVAVENVFAFRMIVHGKRCIKTAVDGGFVIAKKAGFLGKGPGKAELSVYGKFSERYQVVLLAAEFVSVKIRMAFNLETVCKIGINPLRQDQAEPSPAFGGFKIVMKNDVFFVHSVIGEEDFALIC